ncbi:hypothetical protein MTO98_03705 [Mucilaginibacter sp. SMC90]|uniref:hypothetical protein n=1 Tax=Mucilaginibacter sp. SMC90 TaxID=2929803 RepID=UPI001FB37FD7|nr:hypothetical protein [Mucilaginibacter sp. SMC90]UOE50175.1 hypothetical protein MTO98_03705 [Mucilaginibacter sp. SMC90]
MTGLLYPLMKLVSLLVKKGNDYIFKENDYRPADPIDSIPKSPPSDFILLAIKAFIESGKSVEEVKTMLHELNVPDDKTDLVVNIAEKVYKDWCDRKQKANSRSVGILSTTKSVNIQELPDDIIASPVIVHLKPREQYIDFFIALIGKETYRNKATEELLYLMITYATFLSPVKLNSIAQIYQVAFNGFGGAHSAIKLRVIKVNDQRENFFPYLTTKTSAPFKTNEVFEWENNSGFNTEAEIRGTRNDKVALSFFATDYAVNREKYLNKAEINIRISAFALYIYEFKGQDNTSSSNTASVVIPNLKNSGKQSMYNFTGTVLNMSTSSISLKSTSYVLTVRLFKNTDGQNPTTIEVFVNTENIKSGRMRKNIVVKGTLWLQGEIAD